MLAPGFSSSKNFPRIQMSKQNTWDDPDGEPWDSDAPEAVWDFVPKTKYTKMTSLQIDDVLGFGELLRAAATENKTDLIAAKYDPTDRIASTDADGQDLGTAKTQAKTAQLAADQKATDAEALKQSYYTDLSSFCDTMAGALGKTTPKGKAILAIRANLKGTGPKKPKTPPTP
jgi:hypothetical protein